MADAAGEGQVAQEGAVLALHPDQAEAALEQQAPERYEGLTPPASRSVAPVARSRRWRQ